MSFWEQYLAPGDLRKTVQGSQVQHAKPEEQALTTVKDERPPPPPKLDAGSRALRKNGLLYGGIGLAALSVFITRRAVNNKILRSQAAMLKDPKIAGGLDAAQALSLATLNVLGFGMAGLGLIANMFDVADIEDMRNGVRRGVGFDVYGGDEKEDKELEAWVTEVLSQKDGEGLKGGLAGRLAELEKLARERLEQTKK